MDVVGNNRKRSNKNFDQKSKCIEFIKTSLDEYDKTIDPKNRGLILYQLICALKKKSLINNILNESLLDLYANNTG